MGAVEREGEAERGKEGGGREKIEKSDGVEGKSEKRKVDNSPS